ncbi:MAG: hypothetical protein ACKVOM_11035 [Ferruginibacter sp.]
MKKFLAIAVIAATFTACNDEKKAVETVETKDTTTVVTPDTTTVVNTTTSTTSSDTMKKEEANH